MLSGGETACHCTEERKGYVGTRKKLKATSLIVEGEAAQFGCSSPGETDSHVTDGTKFHIRVSTMPTD